MTQTHRGTLVAGIFFVIMGVVFLLDELGAFDLRPGVAWPIVLIGLGIAVVAGAGSGSRSDDG